MSLAKLTPPSAAGLMPRERLFARLDEAIARRLVWIAAPAGAGKTSLATSWLAARSMRSLWYRVDADDADPANFFHYLALAAGDRRTDLPALTPEYLPGLATFARRFFRKLFEAMPAPFVLALDNFQEVPAEAPLHMLVGIAAEELPPGGALFVMSRLGPPPTLARTFTSGMVLGWEELRFTEAETASLLGVLGVGDADKVHAATHGWAAGIVLTARANGVHARPLDAGQAPQAVFDFIAAEFFDALSTERREFLLRVGLFPVVTEGFCNALTGNSLGLAWLAELHREHLLVTLQAQADPAFEFHPLFHAFLKHRFEAEFGASERAELTRRVATALEQAGMINSAADAWARAGDWAALVRLVCTHAPVWLATGRHATVLAWIERLPGSMCEAAPWLMFWAAACRMMNDPDAARAGFERAYASFKADDDLTGQWLSWAGIAETFVFGWDSLMDFDPWIAELESLLIRHREFPSPEVEARVLAGAVALVFRRPDHPLLPVWAARALALIRGRQLVPHTAMLAHFAGVHYMWRGHTHTLDAVLEAVRVVDAPMPPLASILMGLLELVSANFRGDATGVEAAFAAAMATAREHGVHVLDVPLLQNVAMAALARGDADRLEALIGMARPLLLPGRWIQSAFHEQMEAGLASYRGDLAGARSRINASFALITAQGAPLLEIHPRLFSAHLDILDGKGHAVVGELEVILAVARGMGCELYVAATLFTLARVHLDAGDAKGAAEVLREALAIGARWGYGHLFLFAVPDAESQLCALALKADIEPCYVRRLIQLRGLIPPKNADAGWPWPVRVSTLGGFRLLLNGKEFRSVGKPQKKPLELLKALVAQGPAGAVARNLAALLWPDSDGETLKKTLEITLHRLRKLLGRDDAVLFQDGKLVLNSQVCWCDLWAFERLAERAMSCLQASVRDAPAIEHASSHALRLFVGTFLAADEETTWLLPARDHALSRFQRLIADFGRHYEQAGCWDVAGDLYRRGLEQDNLNEFLYRRLIFCLQKQDRHTEALCIYRRCRELLSIVLGVAPSAETESLIQLSRKN